MRILPVTASIALALLAAPSAVAVAEQPANAHASCVAVITSYEASQLPPGSVGAEVSSLASSPGLGATLVSPLAQRHLGSIDACRRAE